MAAREISDPNDPVSADLEGGLLAAIKAVLANLKPDGIAYEHLSIEEGAQDRITYASELLFLIGELGLDLDFDLDALADVTALTDLLPEPIIIIVGE